MPRVAIFNGKCKISIPIELARAKGWDKKGTILRFIEGTDGKVYLEKLK